MKKTLFYSLICIMILFIMMPETSNAQLGGLLKKKKKKGGTTEKVSNIKNPIGKTVTVSADDLKKSDELAEKFNSFFPRGGEGLDYLTIENHWAPSTMADNLKKTNEKLKLYAGGGAKKFYEENKADIDRFLKIGLGKYSMGTNERRVADKWSANGGSSNDGYKAYEKYKASGGSNYKLEDVEKFWKNEGNGMKSSPKGLKATADYSIELAYQEKDKSKSDVIKLLQALTTSFDLFKSMVPEGNAMLTEAKSLENDAKTALKDLGGATLTSMYANDFHKSNTGKIFFSKTPINPKTANAATFTADFTVNDNIYAIAYFDATLLDKEIMKEQNDGYVESTKTYIKKKVFNKYYKINIDGNWGDIVFVAGDAEKMAQSGYLIFGLKPSLDKADNPGAVRLFAKTITSKSPRTHEMEIKMKTGEAGKLKISLTGMNGTQILADAEKAAENSLELREAAELASRGLPVDFMNVKLYNHKFPHVTMAQVRQLAMTRYQSKLGKIDAIVVQDGHYNRTQWEVKVNALGTPINRKGPGYFIAFTGKDGKCYHDFFQIYQDYAGGGGYSATKTAGYSNAGKATAVEYNCAKKKFAK